MAKNQSGVQEVTTTIEKCGLEEGRELQWQIRNFNAIRASGLSAIRQNFGPLNGKILLKLDLTRLSNGTYEVGVQVEPLQNVMWMSVQFKLHGEEVTEFAVSGDPRSVPGNRLVHTLNLPSYETLKFTFVPEILISVSNVVGGQQNQEQSNLRFNADWINYLPPFLQQVVNQRVAEGQHWANFFREYPTEFGHLQRSLVSTLINSEFIRESPRMFQALMNELANNPECANAQQRFHDLISGAQRQCENLRDQARQAQTAANQQPPSEPQPNAQAPTEPQQNVQPPINLNELGQQAFAAFPPLMQGLQNFVNQQLASATQTTAPQPNAQPTARNGSDYAPSESLQNIEQHTAEMIAKNQEAAKAFETATNAYAELASVLRAEQVANQPEIQESQQATQQNVEPTAPPAEIRQEVTTQPSVQEVPSLIDLTSEESEPVQSTSSAGKRLSVSSNSDWTFLFAAKGITGYVRHVKNLGTRVPYHRNFCSTEVWNMPDGQSLKVELVHALHPNAPFICLIDYSETSDMAFVQTLLDGNGQEIHKIDSFSNSYYGFTSDQLIQSAQVDDVVRIKIEAIPNMD